VDTRKLFLAFVENQEKLWQYAERKGFDVAKTNKLVRILRNHKDLMADIASNEVSFKINSTSCATHYSHENCRVLDATWYGTKDLKLIDLVLKAFEEWAEEFRRDQSQTVYAALEKEHDWLTEDQQVTDTIEANECMFDEDGTKANDWD